MTEPMQLNWQAYWEEFKRFHGEPVQFGERLLFPDGWTYAVDSYEGPEWGPPENAKTFRRLQVHYWQKRCQIVRQERDQLLGHIDSLGEIQSNRSVELQHTTYTTVTDSEGREHKKAITESLDIAMLRRGRLSWLEKDLRDCNRKLEELQQFGTEKAVT